MLFAISISFCYIIYFFLLGKKIIYQMTHYKYILLEYKSINLRYFPIPTTIYTLPHEFLGWTKLQKLTINKLYIPIPIEPIYFGYLIKKCVHQYTMSQSADNEFNILRYGIMKHPGYFITPYFIFKVDFLFKFIKRHNIESLIAKQEENNVINFSKKDHIIIENGIAIQHLYAANYYHILLEILPSFFLIKKEFIENSIILYRKDGIVGFNSIVFKKVFNFFGYNIQMSNMWDIGDKTVMAKNLLIFKPKQLCQLDNETILYMKEFIFKKHFDSISKSKQNPYFKVQNKNVDFDFVMKDYIPYRFSLFLHQKRIILNKDEMISAIENKYKKVKFDICPIGIKEPLLNQIIFFHETLLAIGVHSGSFANLLWMMPKSIVIEFNFKFCYSAVYRLSQVIGLRLYSMMFPGSTKDEPVNTDIELVLRAFDTAVKELYRTFSVDYNN